MTVTRWNPIRDFVSLRDAMDRLFEDSFVSPERLFTVASGVGRTLPIEVYETSEEIVVRALCPGVTPEQLQVSYQQGILTLRAQTKSPETHDDWTWHVREFGYGEMARSFTLPKEIDADRAEAHFQDGVLTLRLPKSEQAKPKQIRVATQAQLSAGATK